MNIYVKSVWEKREHKDGVRIMVDGAVPAGMDEHKAQLDFWPRNLAPTGRTMRILLDDPDDWAGFEKAYFAELDQNELWVEIILDRAKEGNVTLIYGYGEPDRNNAAALRHYLMDVYARKRAAA